MHSGLYCVNDECFYMEKDLVKDSDGKYKTELGHGTEWIDEDNYMFWFSENRELADWINWNPSPIISGKPGHNYIQNMMVNTL